jgi:hypothetical protein
VLNVATSMRVGRVQEPVFAIKGNIQSDDNGSFEQSYIVILPTTFTNSTIRWQVIRHPNNNYYSIGLQSITTNYLSFAKPFWWLLGRSFQLSILTDDVLVLLGSLPGVAERDDYSRPILGPRCSALSRTLARSRS